MQESFCFLPACCASPLIVPTQVSDLPPPPRVIFTTADDEDATRIEAVLVALGYAAQRAVPASEYSPERANLRALVSVSRKYGLCPRAQQMLAAIVDGKDSREEQAKALGIDVHHCKWWRAMVLARLNVEDNAGIVACVQEHHDLVLENGSATEYLAEGAAPS